ncbi:unnamed protein product [Phytophthora lilii]|uniref:RxLR effector protein n=1 Tax=Phytophthora lilii TaxID=2077276 RepID=A0A9W6TAT0_9STRA|nr:unnamed protein product [Phytophthora lilii]
MRAYFFVLVVLVSHFLAASAATRSGETMLASTEAFRPIDVAQIGTTTRRALRTGKSSVDDTDREERGYKEVAIKVASALKTKAKVLTNKDFRNLKLFMKDSTTFDKLYTEKATPFNLFREMERNDIVKEGKIAQRWNDYLNFWVKKNAGEL